MTHFTRDDWDARKAEAKYLLDPDDVKGAALHWPAMRNRVRGPKNVFHLLRNIQAYHMDTHGWSDIAYQIAIDQDGNTYQLRGTRYRSGANGDTIPNLQWGAFLLILAQGEQPTNALVNRTNQRLRNFRKLFPNAQHKAVGHQDVRPEPTACPGAIVQYLINAGRFKA